MGEPTGAKPMEHTRIETARCVNCGQEIMVGADNWWIHVTYGEIVCQEMEAEPAPGVGPAADRSSVQVEEFDIALGHFHARFRELGGDKRFARERWREPLRAALLALGLEVR